MSEDLVARIETPNGFTCTVHHHEPHAGGTFGMSFLEFHHQKQPLLWQGIPKARPGELVRYTEP